jgi:HPt (histidine-containing phosphotransfer) domain-containing protein
MTAPFAALKLRFRDRCATDLSVLQQRLHTPEAVSPAELKTLVHQMAGAAGAFGFPQLGAVAMRLDNQLWAGQPPSREDVQALVDELSAMSGG